MRPSASAQKLLPLTDRLDVERFCRYVEHGCGRPREDCQTVVIRRLGAAVQAEEAECRSAAFGTLNVGRNKTEATHVPVGCHVKVGRLEDNVTDAEYRRWFHWRSHSHVYAMR